MTQFKSACGSIYTYKKGDRSWKYPQGDYCSVDGGPIPMPLNLDDIEDYPLKGYFECEITCAETGKVCLINIQATPDLICYGCDDRLPGVTISDDMLKKIKVDLDIENSEDSDFIAEVICFAMNDGGELEGDEIELTLDEVSFTIFEWKLK